MFDFFTKDILCSNDNYHIGDFSYGVPKIVSFGNPCDLYIGKFCSISDNVTIILGGEHRTEWVTTYPFSSRKLLKNSLVKWTDDFTYMSSLKGDIHIGNDVWIGYGVVIKSGCHIGDGCVIGSYSVVSNSTIEPYSIVIGNPGRVIKKRFSGDIIEKLLEIKWWDWDVEKIKQNIDLLLSSDVEKMINKHKGI
jgi:acetyltransferase-like isoleucine patch superfamily enzyme